MADDLTQYWYHRLHHQVRWFVAVSPDPPFRRPIWGWPWPAGKNIIYDLLLPDPTLTAATDVYLGLGYAALFLGGVKALITLGAHSSLPWDKPFYKYKALHPIAWVLERLISTPATHQAHHADTDGDGVGHYKGNFGNMFFLWDIRFRDRGSSPGVIRRALGSNTISRKNGMHNSSGHYSKSKRPGSELAPNGPMVGDAVAAHDPSIA